MGAGTKIEFVDARREHAKFIAWVILTAHRSHMERGLWELVVGGTEADCLRFLEALATTSEPHWAHYSTFIVAEIDGQPAAALGGYFAEEHGMPALTQAMPEANERVNRTEEDALEGFARAGSIVHCAPKHEPGVWIVENVATLPEFRRQGLVALLLEKILERGRERGASQADIGVFIGNDGAQFAYERAGFEVTGEKCHPEFEAVYGCPGVRSLSRPL
jgi:ribosomal protein S18 acetylase RimI-like enzyme